MDKQTLKPTRQFLFVSKVEECVFTRGQKNSWAMDVLDGNPNLYWTQIANFQNHHSPLKPGDSLKNVDCGWTHEKTWTHQHECVGVPQKLLDFLKARISAKSLQISQKPHFQIWQLFWLITSSSWCVPKIV